MLFKYTVHSADFQDQGTVIEALRKTTNQILLAYLKCYSKTFTSTKSRKDMTEDTPLLMHKNLQLHLSYVQFHQKHHQQQQQKCLFILKNL